MIRTFSLIALFFCACCVMPGCGNNSPEFDATQTEEQTAEEIQEAEDYEKQMSEAYKDSTSGAGASQ